VLKSPPVSIDTRCPWQRLHAVLQYTRGQRAVALWASLISREGLAQGLPEAHRIVCKLQQVFEELALREHRIVELLRAH